MSENVVPIDSWLGDNNDTGLLDILPFLDALRFTSDIRSITRNTKFKEIFNHNKGIYSTEYFF
ncbi:hypothetical protein HZS_3991 [Henneguya salminicola]|nr:hypothetical protein HZS_3991 [Henneguya salminicola]